MSIKILVYVPMLVDSLVTKIAERFDELGMFCEIDPSFQLTTKNYSGPVRVRLRVSGTESQHYSELDLLTSFEMSSKEFVYRAPLAVNPAINEALKTCRVLLTLRIHATPGGSVRAGLFFAALLAELTNGVVYFARSDEYLLPQQALEQASLEVNAFESELPSEYWTVVPFTKWN